MNSRIESFIGQASSNDLRIALHYKNAAEILYKSNAYQDCIVLPTLFMIRQFLELSIKYNIRKLNEVSLSNNLIGQLHTVHDLNKIHEAFIAHYKSVKSVKSMKGIFDKNFLDNLNTLIIKISLLDFNSQGFRYSTTKTGAKIITEEETYNLKYIFDLLEGVSDFLTNLEDEFYLNN